MPKKGKSWQEIREKNPERVKFLRSDLPGVADELESQYNILSSVGKEPSEKIRRLIIWIRQEEAVMRDPDYDPDFKCDECGYGKG